MNVYFVMPFVVSLSKTLEVRRYVIDNPQGVSKGSRILARSCREPSSESSTIPVADRLPLPAEPRQALLAGEQFLHGALFDLALLGEELLQGFDEGIRIAQRLGDGFLFGFGRRNSEWEFAQQFWSFVL